MNDSWTRITAVAVSAGFLASAVASAAGPTDGAKPAVPSNRAQIEALEKGFGEAFNSKDVDKIMSCYTHDGLFVFDVIPPREYVGWENYKKDWQELFAANPGPASMEISELSITVVGPVAFGHNIQAAHFTAKDGTKMEVVVRVTDVYRKIGGKWKIVQEHVSVPVDLETLKPDILSKP
jgi:uncharacterized protein (TIGR02246 family)